MKRACKDCDFWQQETNNVELGECRRDPPKFTDQQSGWPSTHANDWCGEFEPRVDEDEQEGE